MSESPVPALSAVASPPRQSLCYEDLVVSEEPLGVGGQAIVYEATVIGVRTHQKCHSKSRNIRARSPLK